MKSICQLDFVNPSSCLIEEYLNCSIIYTFYRVVDNDCHHYLSDVFVLILLIKKYKLNDFIYEVQSCVHFINELSLF